MLKSIPISATVLAVLVASFFTVFASPANAIQFSAEEKNRLKNGETVIRLLPSSGQKGFYGGTGFTLIDANVDEVWEVLTNWRNYPNMFPYTKESSPISRVGNRTLVKMVIGHPIVSVQFHLNIVADKSAKTIQFEMVSNYPTDLDMIRGFWRLFPQPGGRTLAVYVVSADAPPGLVVLVGPKLAHSAIKMLLRIPGNVRDWMKEN